MRACSYLLADGTASYGIHEEGIIRDAGGTLRAKYADLRAVLSAGALGELDQSAKETVSPSDVTMLPPVTNPDKILCIGLNYMTHIRETGRDAPQKPAIFTRYPSSLVGHGDKMVRPHASDWFDFEGELAVIIGKKGRAISRDDALEHVAGFTCFNDGSIRDFQRHTSQFWAGKNFWRSGSMGPWLVTTDELGDVAAQSMQTRLNGEVMQSTPISDLAFDVPALIEYISTVVELLPGDVIATLRGR